jgi:CRP/FNR family transcriptional regulator, cyclic AMP receptor protein
MLSPRQFSTRQIRASRSFKAFDARQFLASTGVGKKVCHYRPKEVVFSQGDSADTLFYIQEGSVRLSVVSRQGKGATIALLGQGDFLGEGCMASDQPVRMATATATTYCSALQIDKREMLRKIHEERKLSDLFVMYLVHRNNRTQEDLVDQLFNSSEKRLARALLLLAEVGKKGRPEELTVNVSQETLAEMIGTTRSRVNFFMNKFKKLGFIDCRRGLRVHSSLLSIVLHD